MFVRINTMDTKNVLVDQLREMCSIAKGNRIVKWTPIYEDISESYRNSLLSLY